MGQGSTRRGCFGGVRRATRGAVAKGGAPGLRMRDALRRLRSDERGDTIMLETMIVMPMLTFIFFLLFGIYSYMYQIWNVRSYANDAAARIGLAFRYYDSSNLTTGEINFNELLGSSARRPFRYYLFDEDKFNKRVTERAVEYLAGAGTGKLTTSHIGEDEGTVVSVEVKSDGMSRHHIEVTVTTKYNMPFVSALRFFGINPPDKITATGYADCLDLGDYIVTTKYVAGMSDKINDIRNSIPGDAADKEAELVDIGKRAADLQEMMLLTYEDQLV